jgi:hypothetical protein
MKGVYILEDSGEKRLQVYGLPFLKEKINIFSYRSLHNAATTSYRHVFPGDSPPEPPRLGLCR